MAETLAVLISVVALIVFFVMASNLAQVKRELINISNLLIQMGEKTDSFPKYECANCGKQFYRKRGICPHCGKRPYKQGK